MAAFNLLGVEKTQIDPALKAQLEKRGQTQKIQELQQYVNKANAPQNWIEKIDKVSKIQRGLMSPTLALVDAARSETAQNLLKDIIRAPVRAVTSVGLEAPAAILSMVQKKKVEPVFIPGTRFEKAVFGQQPIKGVFKRTEETQKQTEAFLAERGVSPGTSQFSSLVTAPLLIGALTAADLAPVGGGPKKAAQLTAKYGTTIAKRIVDAGPEAIKAGLAEDAAKLLPRFGIQFRAGNIRLDKFDAAPEVKDLLVDTVENFNIPGPPSRRPTAELLQQISEKLNTRPEVLVNKFKMQGILNDVDLGVLDNALTSQTDKVLDLTKKYLANPLDGNIYLALAQEKSLMEALQQTAIEGRVAAGRSVQQFRNIRNLLSDPEELNLNTIQKVLGLDFKNFTEEIAKIDLTDEKALKQFLSQSQKASFLDKVVEIRTAGLLSKPATQVVNLIGNTLFSSMQPVIKTLGAGFEAAKTLGGTTRPRKVFFGEALADLLGKTKGIVEATRTLRSAGVDIGQAMKGTAGFMEGVRVGLKTTLNILDNVNLKRIELEDIRPAAIKGTFGRIVRLPFSGLALGDEFGSTVNRTAEIYSLAYAKAAKESKTIAEAIKKTGQIISNINDHPELLRNAINRSEELLFRGDATRFESALLNLRSSMGNVGKILIPFLRTPIQITRQGIRTTPIGFVSAFRATDKRAKALLVGQATMGSGLMGAMAIAALSGNVTGRPPATRAERDLFFREGKKPYSIKVGNTWIAYDRFEPISLPLGIVADIVQTWQETGKVEKKELFAQAFASIAQNLNNKTYLKGMSDLIEIFQDPDRAAEDFAYQTLASFIPSAVGGVARGLDPTIRRPEGLIQTLMTRIPVASKSVPALQTVFGEAVKRPGVPSENVAINIIDELFNPIDISKEREDFVDQQLKKFGLNVTFPSRTQLGVSLDQEAYNVFVKNSGQTIKVVLNEFFKLPEFESLTKPEQKKVADRVVRESREIFQQEIVLESTLREFKVESIDNQEIRNVLKEMMDQTAYKDLDRNKQEKVFLEILDRLLFVESQ